VKKSLKSKGSSSVTNNNLRVISDIDWRSQWIDDQLWHQKSISIINTIVCPVSVA